MRDVAKPVPENPIPVPGPIREPIRGGQLGQQGLSGYDLEARVAGLEAYVQSLATFINPELRPDLAQGALSNEEDLQQGQDAAAQLTKEANDAMTNKMVFDNSAR